MERRKEPGGALLETQRFVESSRDVHHVDGPEERLPRRWRAKRHLTACVFPNGHDDSGKLRVRRAPLKCLEDAGLFRRCAHPVSAIHGNDDHVLSIALKMGDLKSRHCFRTFGGGFSHVS